MSSSSTSGPRGQTKLGGQAWLDEPVFGRGVRRGRLFNPAIRWFTDLLPVRAQRTMLKAALGEIPRIEPIKTLREFIALPTLRLLAQGGYGHRTHTDVCRVFRDQGFTGQLFSGDEAHLPRVY